MGRLSRATFFVTLIVLSACNDKTIKGSKAPVSLRPPADLVSKVSFQDVFNEVIQPKCVSCHGSSGGVSLESFRAVSANLEKIREMTLVTRSMPKSPVTGLTPGQLELLAAWFEAGTPESPPNNIPTPTPAVLSPTFDSIKINILIPKCLSCHKTGGSAERVPLSSREDMLNSPLDIVLPGNPDESGIMLVTDPEARKRMPPKDSGMSALSEIERSAIRLWIQNGAKD